jgi:hypothetical protein
MSRGKVSIGPKEGVMETMRNRLVPRAEWPAFFDAFSRRYEGWLVTVRVLDPRFGSQVEANEMPLEGVVAAPDAPLISLHLGSVASHLEHEIRSPWKVWIEVASDGAEQAVDVDSEDGTRTIIEFRTASLPETADGIAFRYACEVGSVRNAPRRRKDRARLDAHAGVDDAKALCENLDRIQVDFPKFRAGFGER